MANEFTNCIDQFSALGKNYCSSAKKVLPTMDMKKLVEIYEAGLSTSMSTVSEALKSQYNELSDDEKQSVDSAVASTGAVAMLQKANEWFGHSPITGTAVAAGANLFEKVKPLIKDWVGVQKGSTTEKVLDFIDKIIDNVKGLVSMIP
jgi:hypothetical protein